MKSKWLAVAAGVAVGVAAVMLSRRRNIRKFEADVARRRPVGVNNIVLGAEPVHLEGSTTHAVLVVHGFGDTPQSVRPLADALNEAGWTVHAMLLPGHGRSLREYKAARARDWFAAVERAYNELRASHDVVMVCGISMGAALAVMLAERHPDIPALALLAPYLVMPRETHVKTVLAGLVEFPIPYHSNTGGQNSIHDPAARVETRGTGVVTATLLRELRRVSLRAQRALPLLRPRVLYLQSREDNRLNADDAEFQFARIGSTVKEQRWLSGCGHIITVDYCKDEVARQVVAWFGGVQGAVTRER